MNKKFIARCVASSTPVWLKLTKEVSWAYRLKRTHSPTLGFLMGSGKGLLPSASAWKMLRKEVNKQRRNIRAKKSILEKTQAAAAHRKYMRLYMAQRRREARP